MIESKIYNLKEEFFPLLKISINSYNTRKEDLLLWLSEFFNYEIIEGRPLRIYIKEVYGEYQPLPRKGYDLKQRQQLAKQKEKDYTVFTIGSLTTEYELNSYSNVARNAISDFGYEKYKHDNVSWVVRKFVKPAMDEYGERTEEVYWTNYFTYEKLTEEEIIEWKKILKEYQIEEQEAANAFYRQEQGEDITDEKNRYKKALKKAKDDLGIFPIKVPKWKLNQKAVKDQLCITE